MQDHRKLGRELELFHSDPLAGAGLPIWLPDGAAARHVVEEYLYDLERRAGYQHVYSPPMAKREVFQRSGHLAHFGAEMFPPMRVSDDELMLRPSNCPHHAMVYAARGRSYRELPLRIAEIGDMYRVERSGVLGGLSRVRAISLNDSHIFCTEEQAGAEVHSVLKVMREAHAALGFEPDSIRLSLRGEGEKFVDDPAMWDRAEALLRDALGDLSYLDAPGEAAFYGPKIDVQIVDHAGRQYTLATVQVDYHQPARFNLSYVDSEGGRSRPVMVHRSLVGSLERLFAHLIEVHDGAFPAWYAPLQVAALPVGPAQAAPAEAFADRCRQSGLRVEVWYEGSLGSRVRAAARRRVPYAAIVGQREAAEGRVALRLRDGREPGAIPVDAALALVERVVQYRLPDLLPIG